MNTPPPRFISVIIPTYNRLSMLRQTIESLMQQTYPADHYELIVVDDGSTDGTFAYLEELTEGQRLRAIHQTNSGPAAARNTGVQAAKYEWLAFTDDDCCVNPDWLTSLARFLTPQCAVGGPIIPAGSSHWLHRFFLASGCTHPQQPDGAVKTLFSCNMALHRRDLSAVGGFDATFVHAGGEDLDLSYRLLAQGITLTCVSGAFLYHEYPTHWLAFTRHFWSHGQGMGVVFSKWPHQAPPGLAQQGKRRLTAWWGGSPLFPLLLAFWQLLMCLGYSLLRLPQIVRLQWRRSGRSIDQGLVNAFLSAYVLIVEQSGLVAGTYRWERLQRCQRDERMQL